jgi:hypothetical protein
MTWVILLRSRHRKKINAVVDGKNDALPPLDFPDRLAADAYAKSITHGIVEYRVVELPLRPRTEWTKYFEVDTD